MKKTYSELLKDPRWQKKRLEVFERDSFTCQFCGDKETTLNVHHFQYNGKPWDADIYDMITLCNDCHDFEHTWIPKFTPLEKFLWECIRNRDGLEDVPFNKRKMATAKRIKEGRQNA